MTSLCLCYKSPLFCMASICLIFSYVILLVFPCKTRACSAKPFFPWDFMWKCSCCSVSCSCVFITLRETVHHLIGKVLLFFWWRSLTRWRWLDAFRCSNVASSLLDDSSSSPFLRHFQPENITNSWRPLWVGCGSGKLGCLSGSFPWLIF